MTYSLSPHALVCIGKPGWRYNPDQPRDDHGRFGEGGGGYGAAAGGDLTGQSAAGGILSRAPKDPVDDTRGDTRAAVIAHRQGFDAKPQAVSSRELDAMQQRGEVRFIYRGVKDETDAQGRPTGTTAAQIQEQLRSGGYRASLGAYGSGIYTSPDAGHAERYGEVSRMGLRSDARVVSYTDLSAEHQQYMSSIQPGSAAHQLYSDPGRFAMARGYDAVAVPAGTKGPVLSARDDMLVVLNRTALVVEK